MAVFADLRRHHRRRPPRIRGHRRKRANCWPARAHRSTCIQRYPLGPSLGQCCGGVVHLRYEHVSAADAPALQRELQARCARWRCSAAATSARRAGARLLAALPFAVTWIDSRDEIFPDDCRQRRHRALRPGAGRRGRAGAGQRAC
jgi:xanthine/CO dehydrogenase XdhC/CoxF family maturation factor